MLECPLPQTLHYVDDTQPGLTRRLWRGRFIYHDANGERVTTRTRWPASPPW